MVRFILNDGLGVQSINTRTTGLTFSPNGSYAYVTDTGAQYSNFGYNMTAPASM